MMGTSLMAMTNLLPPIPSSLSNKNIAFTTPANYADKLNNLLHLHNSNPLWYPTVVVESTPETKASIKPYLLPQNNNSSLETFSAIAFTSKTGISSFLETLIELPEPPLTQTGEIFTISALGKDAELLNEDFISKICKNRKRIRVLVPPIATPTSMIESLGHGRGRRILCPIPVVIGITEPPVIPDFLRGLESNGWVAIRVSAYETRWAGEKCVEGLVKREEDLDAIVFTSTGEVEGMLKSLRNLGFDWGIMREKWPGLIVAAHGPVTAKGAERLGVKIDVVSRRFDSFDGIVEALSLRWGSSFTD